jgi:hypothetical protein
VNVTARAGSNTFGLQTDLHKSDDILKEKEGKALSQTSARVLTCPTDRASGHEVKIHGNSRYQVFKLEKNQTMIKVIFYLKICQIRVVLENRVFSLFVSSGPKSYAPDAPQPVGLLCYPRVLDVPTFATRPSPRRCYPRDA